MGTTFSATTAWKPAAATVCSTVGQAFKKNFGLATLSQSEQLATLNECKERKDCFFLDSGTEQEGKHSQNEEKSSEGELLIKSGYAMLRNLDNDYTALTLTYLNDPSTACPIDKKFERVWCKTFQTRLAGLLPPAGWQRILWLTILALGLTGAFALTSASVRRLFGSGVEASRLELKQHLTARVLWVAPRGEWIDRLAGLPGVRSYNLSEIGQLDGGTLETELSKDGIRTLLVRDFDETWLEVGDASQRLQAIQKLLGHWHQGIWLISEVVPEYIAAADLEGQSLREVLGSGFLVIHPQLTEREMKAQADSDPEKIWRTLTADEQRACQQVAQAGYFRLGEASSSVGHYGLLNIGTVPRLVSGTFQSFVQRKAVKLRENGKVPATGWASLRWALVLGLSVFLALLFFTQADSFKAISAAISAVGLALAGLWKIGDYLSPSRSGSSARADVGGGA
ncbi:MAG TPA: hypothetical protein VGS07_24990 [Thermoanaerobaculia bacterium]|jgi:hypothetical protein|nr:hypothetical protein [Thermoanaerobaculia bacterium]